MLLTPKRVLLSLAVVYYGGKGTCSQAHGGWWRGCATIYLRSNRISVLKAFLDDSGSGGDTTWFVLGGYVGTVNGWDAFDTRWQGVLTMPPQIDYFKSKEAERLKDQFKGFTEEQRDTKIDALIAVIAQCAERSICARVRQADYNEIVKGKIPQGWDSAYYFLFMFLLGAAIGIERQEGLGDRKEFVFDTEQRHADPSIRLASELSAYSSFAGGIVNVHFENDREFLPLQAADLVAWQIRRAFCFPTEPRRKHFDTARYSLPKEPHEWIVTRKDLVDLMADAQERAKKLAGSLGIPPDMGTW